MSNQEFRILIVEDNDIYRELFKKVLHTAFPDIAIEEAGDGCLALHKVDAFLPDLIFMDIHLHEENGIELAKKIKTDHCEIPVIILTFYDIPMPAKALQFTRLCSRFASCPVTMATEDAASR